MPSSPKTTSTDTLPTSLSQEPSGLQPSTLSKRIRNPSAWLLEYFESISLSSGGSDLELSDRGYVEPHSTGMDEQSASLPVQPFISENLIACFKEYKDFGGPDNIDRIVNHMKDFDIDTWMSGLICSVNEDCLNQYRLFTNEMPAISNKSEGRSLQMSMGIDSECPPGCGCDNPWSYIASS